jgi:diguanylate cyclase (GGDEF)-like protein
LAAAQTRVAAMQFQLRRQRTELLALKQQRSSEAVDCRQQIQSISVEKQDLEILVQTLLEHGDICAENAELAHQDGLTRLSNRRRFDEVLQRELLSQQRTRQPLSLVLMDVDHFKQYNDTYGHAAGDDCLRLLGGLLHGAVRRGTDLAARYGGEEFVLVLPHTGREGGIALAESVRQALLAARIPHATSSVCGFVTLSLGLVCSDPAAHPPPSAAGLIAAADEQLYRAKSQGRNRVCCAPECEESLPA